MRMMAMVEMGERTHR